MEIFGRITGKAVEDKVTEYSEVYGEVLLGLHRDLENQKRLLQDYRERLIAPTNEVQDQLSAQSKQIQHLRFLCIGSYAFGLFTAVMMAWLIR
jgi:hypothetical protein